MEEQKSSGLFRRSAEIFMAVSLAVMVVAVFSNVVLRYAFDTGIVVYEELSRLMFVWLVCIGALVAMADNTHLGLDLIVSRLSGTKLIVFRWANRIITIFVLVLLFYGSWGQVKAGLDSFSPVMEYPVALAAASTLVMSGVMLILLLLDIIRDRRGSGNTAEENNSKKLEFDIE